MLGEGELERLERDAAPRVGRDLERAQAKALQDLQEAVVGRRLERDQVAGLCDRAQREVDRFHAAGGGDEVAVVGAAAPLQGAARDRAPQPLGSRRQAVAAERAAVAAREGGQHAAHALELEQLRRRARRAEGDEARIAGMREHRVGEVVHLDIERAFRRARGLGLLHGGAQAPHVVARLRARLDHADVLETLVGLQHGRDADALLVGKAAHRGHAVAGAQRAGADQLVDLVGELVVERRGFQHEAILARLLCCGQTQLAEGQAITVIENADCYGYSLRDVRLLRVAAPS